MKITTCIKICVATSLVTFFLLNISQALAFGALESAKIDKDSHIDQMTVYARCSVVQIYDLSGNYSKAHDDAYKNMDLFLGAAEGISNQKLVRGKKGSWDRKIDRELLASEIVRLQMYVWDQYEETAGQGLIQRDRVFCKNILDNIKG